MMHWSAPYVGLPFRDKGDAPNGVSCWGLAVLVYREVAGLTLPTFADAFVSSAERAQIHAIAARAASAWPWSAVAAGGERDLDVVLFRRAGLVTHVGILCGPGRMLHVSSGQDSAVVDYQTGRWAPRLAGVYRHASMPEARHVG